MAQAPRVHGVVAYAPVRWFGSGIPPRPSSVSCTKRVRPQLISSTLRDPPSGLSGYPV